MARIYGVSRLTLWTVSLYLQSSEPVKAHIPYAPQAFEAIV